MDLRRRNKQRVTEALAAVGATASRLRHVWASCSMVGRRGMTATRFPHGADIGVRGEGPELQ
jgi:hypothetical protein